MDDIGVAERALQDMRALIQLMQEEVAKFLEKKKKEEEEQEQKSQKQAQLQVEQEAKKAEEQLAQAKAQKKGAGIVFCPRSSPLDVGRVEAWMRRTAEGNMLRVSAQGFKVALKTAR